MSNSGHKFLKSFTLKERSWILYDWANSAYSAIVTAIIFPVFYKSMTSAAQINDSQADSYLGLTLSIGSLIAALAAPILGSLANFKGMKMLLFKIYMGAGVISTLLLAICPTWTWLLIIYAFTIVGFHGSLLFYDAFLVEVTTEERMDRVSTYGYALGYIGGSTIPLLATIALLSFGPSIGVDAGLAARISFIMTSIWWFAFSIPMMRHVKQEYYIEREPGLLKKTFINLWSTLKSLKDYKAILFFLIAYFFYIDGVNTIIGIAASFSDTIGIDSNFMIMVMLGIQIIAFPFAILFGKAASKFGTRALIMFGIVVYSVSTLIGFNLSSSQEPFLGPLTLGQLQFLIEAFLIATSQGGIQALSRSYFGKMVPLNKANEFFGFFDIFSKFAAIMGPALFAFATMLTGDSRYGVLSILLLFIVGGVVFFLSWRFSDKESSQARN
ncbi:MAG: MFS transporter [Clostridiales bacterium]|jgi:UMF1 family MFS transporter|nr:MFS transporter [Clostridiales bacterium]